MTAKRQARRVGMVGQIEAQGRSHPWPDCGSYQLVECVGPSRWVVEWTAPCCRRSDAVGSSLNRSTIQFVSADAYARNF